MDHKPGHRMTAVTKLAFHPDNPRQGDVGAIIQSIEANGWVGSIVAQCSTGRVLAGNHRLQAATHVGMTKVPVHWVDVDDDTARRILLADNRVADLATYDDNALAELLTDLAGSNNLPGTGWDGDDVDDLLAQLTGDDFIGHTPPAVGSLAHNVDVYFNASPALAKLATTVGIRPGIISSSVSDRYVEQVDALSLDIGFVDNEFKEYDHARHVDAVARLQPKYATVRDIMTKAQCKRAGIDFYTFDEVMDMARDVAAHAENVIVIPKTDCIDDIPDEFMLGYSVPSSYGGTPIDLDRFAGRRVHLLGGNWKRQRNAIGRLGDSVVSLDNNHLLNIARFGNVYGSDGMEVPLATLMPEMYGNAVSMVVSMARIIADLGAFGCDVNGRKVNNPDRDDDTAITEPILGRDYGDVHV